MMAKLEQIEYLKRSSDRLQRRIDQLQLLSNRYSWRRVGVFVVGILASFAIFFIAGPWLFAISLTLALTIFGVIVYIHNQIDEALNRATVLQQVKVSQWARSTLDWAQMPAPKARNPRFDHPYEADLDLVGERSLHRLLDTTVSTQASERLRTWLTQPAPACRQIEERQALVRELIPATLFRNKLAVNGLLVAGTTDAWTADHLLTWLQKHPPIPRLGVWVGLLSGLALLNLLLFGVYLQGWIGPFWQATFGLYALLQLTLSIKDSHSFHEAKALQDDLERLGYLFQHLEGDGYHNRSKLQRICASFRDAATRPSVHLRQIGRIVAAIGIQGNPLIALLLNVLFPWGAYFAWRLDCCKQAITHLAPVWLDTWYEVEALSALATFAELNPDYSFPKLQEAEKQGNKEAQGAPQRQGDRDAIAPIFAVQGLGHPLIPEDEKVRNDYCVDHLGCVAILTGSNMAGKSSFLKALGMNLALAYAGSVVDAQELTTIRFRLFTCIKVSDSVTDGISYFYAEVKRLKALLNALTAPDEALPLFYCVDEIFRGTNNRERLQGSRAYIHALVAQKGVGLIATHDLELTRLAEELPNVVNYHFRDDLTDGRMVFDYTLRAGPCPTTNALKIMQSEGLPIK